MAVGDINDPNTKLLHPWLLMDLDVNNMGRREHQQDDQSRVFFELSALIMNLLRHPRKSIQFSDEVSTRQARRLIPFTHITPAGLASLTLGVSLSLMVCGLITFFIGFLVMPWVIGLVMVFYVIAIISSLAMVGRAIFYHSLSPEKGVVM
ncbi:hypothetical protein L1987_11886 [Smallanthus sonchifolius]|uniref:Uncharacterized protein n=1 Tax=Smallanthus sonchifolius TaxID=185202 RepID=A0ACB9JDS6_9ASTR|nr:hypothetical protein L1987_11886 [Smallanthus sonchifolius]